MNELTTFEKFAEAKKVAAGEVGTMAPCPWCGRRRVQRSDYVRCIPCGVNWLNGEDMSKDPRAERLAASMRGQIRKTTGAPTE